MTLHKKFSSLFLYVYGVCMWAHMCSDIHVKLRGQLLWTHLSPPSVMWILGFKSGCQVCPTTALSLISKSIWYLNTDGYFSNCTYICEKKCYNLRKQFFWIYQIRLIVPTSQNLKDIKCKFPSILLVCLKQWILNSLSLCHFYCIVFQKQKTKPNDNMESKQFRCT